MYESALLPNLSKSSHEKKTSNCSPFKSLCKPSTATGSHGSQSEERAKAYLDVTQLFSPSSVLLTKPCGCLQGLTLREIGKVSPVRQVGLEVFAHGCMLCFCFFPFILQLKFASSQMQLLQSHTWHYVLPSTHCTTQGFNWPHLSACNDRKGPRRSCSGNFNSDYVFQTAFAQFEALGESKSDFHNFYSFNSLREDMQNVSKPLFTHLMFINLSYGGGINDLL